MAYFSLKTTAAAAFQNFFNFILEKKLEVNSALLSSSSMTRERDLFDNQKWYL